MAQTPWACQKLFPSKKDSGYKGTSKSKNIAAVSKNGYLDGHLPLARILTSNQFVDPKSLPQETLVSAFVGKPSGRLPDGASQLRHLLLEEPFLVSLPRKVPLLPHTPERPPHPTICSPIHLTRKPPSYFCTSILFKNMAHSSIPKPHAAPLATHFRVLLSPPSVCFLCFRLCEAVSTHYAFRGAQVPPADGAVLEAQGLHRAQNPPGTVAKRHAKRRLIGPRRVV